jgi:AraC-like DNA-binding protein/Tfp pilus assembly protein PilF
MKILFLVTLSIFLLLITGVAQNLSSGSSGSSQHEALFSKLKQLSQQQLFDMAESFFDKTNYDTALICYKLIISAPASASTEQQSRVIFALHRTGTIFYYLGDYRNAYKYLIDALLLCEQYNIPLQFKIYNVIGNIFSDFDKNDIAKSYYTKALSVCEDTTAINSIFNNLGYIELESDNYETSFYYLKKSLQACHNNDLSCNYNNLASLYHKMKQYDSAYYYFRVSLNEAKKNTRIGVEVQSLSDMGKLFFEMNKPDSAIFYINLSNALAEENNLLKNLPENYLTLSIIEESKGNIRKAFEYYKKHVALKDSLLNNNIFGDINQLQRLYEISKTNQQIEQLMVEQQIKEKTIHYQRIMWITTLCVLLLVSIGLWYIYVQKRDLGKSYKVLFEKNIEILKLQNISQETHPEKYRKSAMTDDLQYELVDKILLFLKDVSVICDAEFSLDKLAELTESNRTYVSQAINTALKQNFNTLLNSYRIREAQRLVSDTDAAKYTIESVSLRVGFKSIITFYNAFKEITGVTPKFYFKSIQEQNA